MKDLPRISVGLVVWRETEVLLIRRANPPFQGCWSIPGGKLEYGERLVDAALRELQEETATTAQIAGLIDVFESITEHGRDRVLLGETSIEEVMRVTTAI